MVRRLPGDRHAVEPSGSRWAAVLVYSLVCRYSRAGERGRGGMVVASDAHLPVHPSRKSHHAGCLLTPATILFLKGRGSLGIWCGDLLTGLAWSPLPGRWTVGDR
jgi:hypothetical protein